MITTGTLVERWTIPDLVARLRRPVTEIHSMTYYDWVTGQTFQMIDPTATWRRELRSGKRTLSVNAGDIGWGANGRSQNFAPSWKVAHEPIADLGSGQAWTDSMRDLYRWMRNYGAPTPTWPLSPEPWL